MMELEQQLKLQAFADGELAGPEAAEVAAWVERDPQAAGLVAELRQTSAAFTSFGDLVKVPETREFYWSKISRAIDLQHAREERGAARETPWLARLRRLMVPLAVMGLFAVFTAVTLFRAEGRSGEDSTVALEDTQAFTYHDFSARATLVWLSYPADKHMPGEDEFTAVE